MFSTKVYFLKLSHSPNVDIMIFSKSSFDGQRCGLLCPPQATRKWRNEEGHFLAEKGKDHSECTKTDEHKEIVYNTLFEDVMNGQEALRRLTTGDESAQLFIRQCCSWERELGENLMENGSCK